MIWNHKRKLTECPTKERHSVREHTQGQSRNLFYVTIGAVQNTNIHPLSVHAEMLSFAPFLTIHNAVITGRNA